MESLFPQPALCGIQRASRWHAPLALFALLLWWPLAELHTAESLKWDFKPNAIIMLADDLG
jgi:hypothetical protein